MSIESAALLTELELGGGREHLEHLATSTGKFSALGSCTVAQLTAPLGMGD